MYTELILCTACHADNMFSYNIMINLWYLHSAFYQLIVIVPVIAHAINSGTPQQFLFLVCKGISAFNECLTSLLDSISLSVEGVMGSSTFSLLESRTRSCVVIKESDFPPCKDMLVHVVFGHVHLEVRTQVGVFWAASLF